MIMSKWYDNFLITLTRLNDYSNYLSQQCSLYTNSPNDLCDTSDNSSLVFTNTIRNILDNTDFNSFMNQQSSNKESQQKENCEHEILQTTLEFKNANIFFIKDFLQEQIKTENKVNLLFSEFQSKIIKANTTNEKHIELLIFELQKCIVSLYPDEYKTQQALNLLYFFDHFETELQNDISDFYYWFLRTTNANSTKVYSIVHDRTYNLLIKLYPSELKKINYLFYRYDLEPVCKSIKTIDNFESSIPTDNIKYLIRKYYQSQNPKEKDFTEKLNLFSQAYEKAFNEIISFYADKNYKKKVLQTFKFVSIPFVNERKVSKQLLKQQKIYSKEISKYAKSDLLNKVYEDWLPIYYYDQYFSAYTQSLNELCKLKKNNFFSYHYPLKYCLTNKSVKDTFAKTIIQTENTFLSDESTGDVLYTCPSELKNTEGDTTLINTVFHLSSI